MGTFKGMVNTKRDWKTGIGGLLGLGRLKRVHGGKDERGEELPQNKMGGGDRRRSLTGQSIYSPLKINIPPGRTKWERWEMNTGVWGGSSPNYSTNHVAGGKIMPAENPILLGRKRSRGQQSWGPQAGNREKFLAFL